MRYWDEEHHFNFRCPLCRASAGRVRERVNITALRDDFEPDAAAEFALAETLREIFHEIALNPQLRPVQMPRDAQMALGRHMEQQRLRAAFRSEESGAFPRLP